MQPEIINRTVLPLIKFAEMIKGFTGQMKDAAARLDFEKAAMLRDEIRKLEKKELEASSF